MPPETTPSTPYVELDRDAWTRLSASTPLPLTVADVSRLRGLGDPIDLAEVEKELGISRTVLREALKVLTGKGLVDARQKRVVRVVRKAGGKISRSELCRKTQWLTQRERQEVIDNLLETQQLRQEEESSATRPKVVYALP